jgi:hypothetical protein
MAGAGKDYRKGDPLRGAAVLMLSCELKGITGDAAKNLIASILKDLKVTEEAARDYLRAHRDELLAALQAHQEQV